ncbi:MAG: alpha-glucosidase, partial [Pseudomonadota bacterium]
MKALTAWQFLARTENGIRLIVEGRHRFNILVLEDDLVRVSLLKDGTYRLDRTWAIAPEGDVPFEGRKRDDVAGFSCPDFHLDENDDGVTLETGTLRLKIGRPLCLTWEARDAATGLWQEVARDRPQNAYMLGRKDHRNQHHILRHADETFYGLGEKSGPLERSGRR